MKVLLINGSPKAKGNTAYVLSQMAEVFTNQGIEAQILHVGNQDIRGCVACGGCSKTGKCVFDDAVNEAAEAFREADGLVLQALCTTPRQTPPWGPLPTACSTPPALTSG